MCPWATGTVAAQVQSWEGQGPGLLGRNGVICKGHSQHRPVGWPSGVRASRLAAAGPVHTSASGEGSHCALIRIPTSCREAVLAALPQGVGRSQRPYQTLLIPGTSSPGPPLDTGVTAVAQ